jgi:copper chaperone CopZ
LIILAISIPLYVCATGSVPIAAVLMMKGISPGTALVFLMAGPASNAATITVIGNVMGRRTLFTYLGTIVVGALASGLIIDYLLPREWFIGTMTHMMHEGHTHEILPYWVQALSGITITLLIFNVFIQKLIKIVKGKKELKITNDSDMGEIKVFVRGMTCNHCKMSVETNLKKIEGVDNIVANLENEIVTITGEKVNLDKVKETIESIGYKYDGKVA